MSEWKRFTRRDCPVCNGARKDCRQNLSTNLIHCRDSDANPIDYLFRKLDAWGFGLWAYKPDAESWTDERREEWRQQKSLEREAQKRQLEQQRAKLLNESQRDRVILSILSQLTLTDTHRKALQQRGLTDEEIHRGHFRSVSQWQKLDFPVNDRLAGVKLGGRALLAPDSGILCPIPNPQGLLSGWQLRRDNPDGGGKYIWASGDKRIKPPPSSHLPNGELPIAVWMPSDGKLTGIVGLTEGTSIKPYIASLRLNIPVLGGSGGNFVSSPQTVKAYLETLGASVVRLYADAGSILNPSVLAQYRKTFELLVGWGYAVEVGWWGQVEKPAADIDEINAEAIASIRYLTPDDFLELAEREQRRRKVAEAQKKLNSLTYPVDLLLEQRYLTSELIDQLPSTGIIGLLSHKGSGKSVQIKKLIAHFRLLGRNIISITPRIALGREQANKWDIEWIEDSSILGVHKLTLLENQATIGLCWDSLGKLFGRDWSNTVVIIDESELGFSHLATSSTCRDRRPFILRTFEEKIKECLDNKGLVILSDADLTDVSVDYVKALSPDRPVFTVVNVHKPDPWEIDFYTGKVDEVIDQIFEDVEAGQEIAIATDSQTEAEALDEELTKRFPDKKIIRIDRKTTETDFGRDFVARPNESLLSEKPDVLIYTPSMGVGVSIDVPWFAQVYGLFYGVLEPSQCRQMLARVRKPVPRTIWVKEASYFDDGCKSFLPEVVKKQLWKFNDQGLNLIELADSLARPGATEKEKLEKYIELLEQIKEGKDDNPHLELYAKLIARRDFGLSQLAVQLRQELIEEGHKLTDWATEDSTALGDAVNNTKKAIKVEEAAAIARATDIPLEKAQAIARKLNSTEDERHQATKALLKAELPGVDLTPEFVYKAVIKDRRRWLNQVKLFWYTQNPEKTKELDRREWKHKLKQFQDGVVFLPDVKTYSTKVKALEDLGLFELIDLKHPDKEFTANDEEVRKFGERAYFMRYRIHTAFNLTVTKKTEPIHLIDRLLKRVGLKLTGTQKRVEGDRLRVYQLDSQLLHDPDRIAVLAALNQKYAEIQTRGDLEGVTELASSINILASSVTGLDRTKETQNITPLAADRHLPTEEQGMETAKAVELSNLNEIENKTPQSQLQHDNEGVTELANRINNPASSVTDLVDRFIVLGSKVRSKTLGQVGTVLEILPGTGMARIEWVKDSCYWLNVPTHLVAQLEAIA